MLKKTSDPETEDYESPEQGVITLCGVQGCCPTVDFTQADEVILRDDHGGQVRLTRAEWAELKQKFATLSRS